jgi:RND family efflux transporter MFP subunit
MKSTEVSVVARTDLLLVVATALVSASFSPSMSSVLAQTSTEGGKEVREFRGTIVPARTVEISPRYNGLLSKIDFIPGQFVEEGNLLFEFRANDQELAVDIDQSKLQRAEADLRMAELTLKNKQDLHAKKIISETETLQAEASRDIAAASVVEARLTVQLSQSVLKNMKLYAPMSGVISRSSVAEGAFITKEAREQSNMALITQLNPIRVIYHIPFEIYAQTVEILKTSDQANEQRQISLILPNGEKFAYTGKIVTGSNEFDRDTQMIDILAEFPNPTYLLRPGLNVIVQTRILPSQR